MGGSIVDKCGVGAPQIRCLDVVEEEFERIRRANVMLVATPCIPSHLFNCMLTELDLAVLNRTEPFDPVVEQVIQSSAKPLPCSSPRSPM